MQETIANRYRVKPELVDAIRWDGTNIDEMREFLDGVPDCVIPFEPMAEGHSAVYHVILFPTSGGRMSAKVGEWIVRDEKGRLTPYEDRFFRRKFELA